MTASGGRGYRIPPPPSRGGGASQPPDDAILPSVTTVLNVLDKGGLLPWAIRTCLAAVRLPLTASLSAALTTCVHPLPLPPSHAATLLEQIKLEEVLAHAARASDAFKSSAAALGTRVHAAIDAYITGRGVVLQGEEGEVVHGRSTQGGDAAPLRVESDIVPVVRGFMAWYARAGVRLSTAGDTSVYSRTYGYAGSLDCVGRTREGGYVVLDFKTSNSVHNSYALQLAAYVTALQEMHADGELDIHSLFPPLPEQAAASQAAAVQSTSLQSAPGRAAGVGVKTPRTAIPSPIVDEAFVSGAARASSHTRSMSTHADAAPVLPAVGASPSATGPLMFVDDGCDVSSSRASDLALPPEMRIEGWVVRLDKVTGDVSVSRVRDVGVAFQAFKAALMLWHAAQSDLMQEVGT